MTKARLSHSTSLILFLLAGIICFGFGLSLRLDSLADRPVHADEATGARILAERLESGSYSFDPIHFHGPLLTALAEPVARLRGEHDWRSLTPGTLRIGIAWIGALTILLALGFAPWAGFRVSIAAAVWIATSPFLVYYSRVFIHETLFGFLAIGTVLALFAFINRPSWWTAASLGIVAGLLMATRETFVICFFAWAVAGAFIGVERYRRGRAFVPSPLRRRILPHALIAGVVSLLVVAVFFTDWGRDPSGFAGFFLTFFLYETGEGHDKPFYFYTWMLLWPKSVGVWWTEAGIGIAALLGFILSFRHPQGVWIRFLFYSAIVQGLVYSSIAYKTPWLMVVTWLHLCLVAGAGAVYLLHWKNLGGRILIIAALVSVVWWQTIQTNRAVHRFASDMRNPYVAVPTSGDVKRLASFLSDLGDLFPEVREGPVAVIGSGYWPLPWYLREIPSTGYWPNLPEHSETFPILLVLPRQLAVTRTALEETHISLPRGLRVDTRIYLFIRNDIWEAYMNDDDD